MSVSLRKVEGIDSVTLTLRDGTARIALTRGNTVTLEQLRDLVRKNGFTPREAVITAEAEVSADPVRPELTISGTKERLRVRSDWTASGRAADLQQHRGRRVLVTGAVTVPTKDQPAEIEISRIDPLR